LVKNSKDFIRFKASFLSSQSIQDPILKAKTINEMVTSISIIPDRIKQELYVKHCSKIMDISEDVLFNSLAQQNKSEVSYFSKRNVTKIQKISKNIKVDVLFELEKKIIEILLLYGNRIEKFDELILKKDKNGEVLMEPSVVESLVYEKIFLDLQQDEVEFTNESFKILYKKILSELQKNGELVLDVFLNSLDSELSNHVTSILMNEDRYQLHDWFSKDIVVKDKKKLISQLVSETILSLRTYLINEKVKELQSETQNNNSNNEILEEITDYYKLKSLLSKKLNRVL
jgi:DNA primase